MESQVVLEMNNGSGWDEACHPNLLKAHTQPMTTRIPFEEPWPWATFHVKAWLPDAKLQSQGCHLLWSP